MRVQFVDGHENCLPYVDHVKYNELDFVLLKDEVDYVVNLCVFEEVQVGIDEQVKQVETDLGSEVEIHLEFEGFCHQGVRVAAFEINAAIQIFYRD